MLHIQKKKGNKIFCLNLKLMTISLKYFSLQLMSQRVVYYYYQTQRQNEVLLYRAVNLQYNRNLESRILRDLCKNNKNEKASRDKMVAILQKFFSRKRCIFPNEDIYTYTIPYKDMTHRSVHLLVNEPLLRIVETLLPRVKMRRLTAPRSWVYRDLEFNILYHAC